MAYYSYSIIPTTWQTANLDPSTELFTFFGYHMTQWANLAGPGVSIVANHTDYTASLTGTGYRYYLLQLDSPDRLAGLDPNPGAMGFYFAFYTYFRSGWWRDHTPGTANSGAGSFTADEMQYNTSINFCSASEYNSAKPATVFYSDTPGERYFAYSIRKNVDGTYGTTYSGVLHEITKDSRVPAEQNVGWAFNGYGRAVSPLTRDLQTSLSPYAQYSSWVEQYNNTPGNGHFRVGEPVMSRFHVPVGYTNSDILLRSWNKGPYLGSISYKGKRYTNFSNAYDWVRTG